MTVIARHRLPGLVRIDHRFELPVDHAAADGPRLSVFAREVVDPAHEHDTARPWLVFLQGGPGGASPRPHAAGGWVGRAIRDFRVLLLDQRGTGLSTPVAAETVPHRDDPAALAAYLAHFRADGIVADCEAIRRQLVGEDGRWCLLGQSFGGFCATHYLSVAPTSLAAVMITGGLPPLDDDALTIYRRTYPLVEQRNAAYFARFPEDRERLDALLRRVARGDVLMPSGEPLSVRRVLALGLAFGMSDGAAMVHDLLELALPRGPDGPVSQVFLRGLDAQQPYATQPLFSVLHEACYAQGPATNWAAQRVRDERPAFALDDHTPPLFTGEMIYPWMFEELPTLRPFARAADLLARKDDWPRLYDADVLARNTVPVAAAVYHDDMYVHREPSLATADVIAGLRTWVTNEHEHNGLRAAGEAVLERLLALLADQGFTP